MTDTKQRICRINGFPECYYPGNPYLYYPIWSCDSHNAPKHCLNQDICPELYFGRLSNHDSSDLSDYADFIRTLIRQIRIIR